MEKKKETFSDLHSKKYRHVGYSYASVPNSWKAIVQKAIEDIEKEMWPRWIPMFIKRKIHKLAMGNSVFYIKGRFWYSVRKMLTKGMIITDIKTKFADLRIYGNFNDKIYKIIEEAEINCDKTCEKCGSSDEVKKVGKWVYNLCKGCRNNKKKSSSSN